MNRSRGPGKRDAPQGSNAFIRMHNTPAAHHKHALFWGCRKAVCEAKTYELSGTSGSPVGRIAGAVVRAS